MENISIQTTQNISIEQAVASVAERIAATALDYILIVGYIIVVSFIAGISKGGTVIFISLISPVALYHLLSEIFMNGQSWGKKILKIKVVMKNGNEATFMPYFIRWIFRLIDGLTLFGSVATITIILNGKGQRLGDIAANTTIIRLKENKLSDTLFIKLPDDYKLVFPEVSKLNHNDILTAKEVFDFLKLSQLSDESIDMAFKAKNMLENKMGIKSGMRSEQFLSNIIRDYNFLNSK